MHDNANPTRMVAPVAGKYMLYCNASILLAGPGRRAISFAVNGDHDNLIAVNGQPGDAGHYTDLSLVTHYQLNAGDYVEGRLVQNSGSTLTAYGFPNGTGGPECGMVKLP
jgi:hypothetical protein